MSRGKRAQKKTTTRSIASSRSAKTAKSVRKKKIGLKVAKPSAKPRAASRAKSRAALDLGALTLRQAVRAASDLLRCAGYDPVLTGSACAALYAGAGLRPTSIDFVIGEYNAPDLDEVMRQAGFTRASMHQYESTHSPYDVVFLPPPLAVGDDVVRKTAVMQARPGTIRLLHPTDCVRQRLSMFYRWGDERALEEAIAVASKQAVDMELVRRWSEWEWCSEKYDLFARELKEKTSNR